MAMGSTGGGEGLSSEINVTPLIDVLLVLLIIFMITQPMSRKAFDVQVPPKQLEQAFHQIYDPRPAKLLFIKAAPNRKYIDVMQAMDIAHGAGVQVIGFTPPEQAKK